MFGFEVEAKHYFFKHTLQVSLHIWKAKHYSHPVTGSRREKKSSTKIWWKKIYQLYLYKI
jgi:hypothetical protein